MTTLLLFAASIAAQDAQTTATPVDPPKPFVRRFSAGAVLSFSGFQLMEDRSLTDTGATRTTTYTTNSKSSRFGGGVVLQAALGDRFAVAGSAVLRRVRFETNIETTENSKTSKQEDVSSADFWEFPIVLRRYSKDRFEPGKRWFAEGGLALRRVRNIRSSLQTTDINSKVVCCDERPIAAQNRLATGFTVGGGYQFVDSFGLRFVPSIRYTRWMQPTFDRLSVRSNRNQLEALIAITF
jgi:hypothetical protein